MADNNRDQLNRDQDQDLNRRNQDSEQGNGSRDGRTQDVSNNRTAPQNEAQADDLDSSSLSEDGSIDSSSSNSQQR